MTTVKSIAIVLFLCLVVSTTDLILPIADKSATGSPIENTGTVTLSEWTADGNALMSLQSDWKSTNISQKSILAFVETMDVLHSNGSREEVAQEYDAFFHPRVVQPGEVLPMTADTGTKMIEEKYSKSVKPTCEVTVRWVQFVDGTTFGDEKYAQQVFTTREGIWGALAHLNDVYTSGGPDEFLQELQKPLPDPGVNGYIEHLRIFQKEHTTTETEQRVQEHLRMAEQRSTLLR